MKTSKSPLFFCFLVIIIGMIFGITTPAHASPALTLTVTTDKPAYYPDENVTIYGNLTQDGALVPDGLVAIQVKNPKDQTLVIRTTTTGAAPPGTPYVKVRSVIPCNSSGGPKDSFRRGTLAYFNVTVTNYDIEPRQVLITVNIYNPNNIPIGYDSLSALMQGSNTSSVILCIPIPDDAALGEATVYANVYTNWPSWNGWPYCPEVSATFIITSGGLSLSTISKQKNQFLASVEINGNYNTTFKLATQAEAGNYIIYATSRYYGEETFNNTTFRVLLLGDFDGDGDVDGVDLGIFGRAYVEYWASGVVDSKCDMDGDEDVDGVDLGIFGRAYVEYWAGA